MIYNCKLSVQNDRMKTSLFKDLHSGDARLLRDLGEIIRYGTDSGRTDLRIEARLAGLWGLNEFTKSAEYKKATQDAKLAHWKKVKEYYLGLAADLTDLETFCKWPNGSKVSIAKQIAADLESISAHLKQAKQTEDAKEFHESSEKINKTLREYQRLALPQAGYRVLAVVRPP